jgi:cytoskeleton protein RodZ
VSVGTALSEARARAGLSLDQVAEQTRIRRTLIENIEHDDFHACGGDFYARGHIRSIAHVLDIDPEPLVREFDGEHRPEMLTPTASGVLVAEKAPDHTRSRPNWSAAMVAALVLVVGFGGYAALTDDGGSGNGGGSVVAGDRPSDDAPGDSDDSGDEASGSGSGSGGETSGSAPTDAVAQAPSTEGVTVTLATNDGRTWVSATGRNGRVLYEGILQPNREKTVRDSSKVFLVVGNAGAVELTVNGEELGSPGANGEVQRLTFGPGAPDVSGG